MRFMEKWKTEEDKMILVRGWKPEIPLDNFSSKKIAHAPC